MSYSLFDFQESLNRVGIPPSDIVSVLAAWGHGDGMGEDAGHYRYSGDGATDWSGGFLFALSDGRFCYVEGWCDYTGWGCQDGATVTYFDARPDIAVLEPQRLRPDEWDHEPADLNRWIQSGALVE